MRALMVAVCLLLSGSFSAHAQASPRQAASHPPAAQQQSTPQQATPAAASQKANPQEEDDIRRLFKLTGTAAVGMQAFHNTEDNMRSLMTKALPPGAYREKLITLFFQKVNSKVNAQTFYNLLIPIYERNFTDDDIKDLIRFYQTPVGQKYVKALPEVSAEIHATASGWGEKLGRESMSEVLSEHPELKKALEEATKKEQQQ